MSDVLKEWDQYPVEDKQDKMTDLWDQMPVESHPEHEDRVLSAFQALPSEKQSQLMEDMLRWGAREVLKPSIEGASSIADIPSALYNLAGMGIKAGFDQDIGQAPYPSDYVGKGVDYVTQGYSEGDPGLVGSVIKGGTSVLSGGGIAGGLGKMAVKTGSKALSHAGKFAGYTGSTKALPVAGGAVAGGTFKGLTDEGVDPLTATGGAIGTDIATQAVGTALSRKPVLTSVGLGRKKFDTKTYEKAKDLGIDLPASALSDSEGLALMNQITAKTPIVGDKIRAKNKEVSGQIQKHMDDIADNIGPSATQVDADDLLTVKKELYDKARKHLTDDARSPLQHTKKLMDDIKADFADSKNLSDGEKAVLDYMTDIERQINNKTHQVTLPDGSKIDASTLPKATQEQMGIKAQEGWSISELIRTKRSLNDKLSPLYKKEDKDTRKLLNLFNRAYRQDIYAYGKDHPEFLNAFKEAESLHGQINARQTFDDKLEKIISHPSSEDFNYGSFNRFMATGKNQRWVQKEFGKDVLGQLKQINDVAKANAKAILRTPNPSGSGVIKSILDGAKGFMAMVTTGHIFNPMTYGTATILPAYAKRLLTNPKVLEKAYNYAKEPNYGYAKQLINTLKTQTGVTIKIMAHDTPGYVDKETGKVMQQPIITIRPQGKHG